MGFTSLGLSAPILKAIQEKGYDTPSPIQAKAIPAIFEKPYHTKTQSQARGLSQIGKYL